MQMNHLQLIDAVKDDNLAAAKALIEAGADINQQDEQGWPPLNWAAGKGKLEMVTLLVGMGADVFKVGQDQRSPYLIALAAGHAEVVKFLRQVEDQIEGGRLSRVERKYCRAYRLGDLRRFAGWKENLIDQMEPGKDSPSSNDNKEGQGLSDDDIVFLHQDYIVTLSMWQDENVIFKGSTQEWKDYCTDVLKFDAPEDLDFCV
jgi:hypothetical protein